MLLLPVSKMDESFINPDEILDQVQLEADMVAAEFGCGSGGFLIPLAKRLEDGLVYGIDIQEAPLSSLKSRALLENVANIRIILSDLEAPRGSTISDLAVDLVFIPNVLFQVEDKNAIITEAERILKKQGKLIIIDWLPQAVQGPAQDERVAPKEIKKMAEELGFKLEEDFKAGKYHYALVFKKL